MQLLPQQCPTRPGHLPRAHHRPAVRRSECTSSSHQSRLKLCLLAHSLSPTSAGLPGADVPLLWLLQGGQNPLPELHLQPAAGLPAGHHRLPVPQPRLDRKAVPRRALMMMMIMMMMCEHGGLRLTPPLLQVGHWVQAEPGPGRGSLPELLQQDLLRLGLLHHQRERRQAEEEQLTVRAAGQCGASAPQQRVDSGLLFCLFVEAPRW